MWGKIVQWRILNQVNLHQASMIVTGTGYMLLPMIKSYGGLIAYCTVHGLVDGCFVVLLPIVTSKLVGSEKASVAWGFLVAVCSLTFMTGPPMAGKKYLVCEYVTVNSSQSSYSIPVPFYPPSPSS
jgi:MCP family monocarboxylic acid transporter-like MFS transporter 10